MILENFRQDMGDVVLDYRVESGEPYMEVSGLGGAVFFQSPAELAKFGRAVEFYANGIMETIRWNQFWAEIHAVAEAKRILEKAKG